MTFAASLPPSCRQSVAHALLTCGGGAPAYFTPGFAPLSLAWGWLLVGRAGCDPCVAVARAPCSNGAGGCCAACSRGGRRRAFAMRGAGRRKRAGYGSGGSGAAAGRVTGNVAGGPIASSAPRRGANPSAAQCASLGPPPAPLARPRQRRPSVTCLFIEICTNSIGAPALQPFTAHSACQPAAFAQPWPLAKTVVCLSLRGSEHAPVARLCIWRTTVSSKGLGPQLLGGHVARHCRQWCTWRRWRRQRRPLARPRRSLLAMMHELSAAAPAADLWTATRRTLAVSRQAERGRSGPPQLRDLTIAAMRRSHRAGEAAAAEVDAEDLVMREAKATVMQGAKARATARATARQSSWPGPSWDWAVRAGRFFVAVEPFFEFQVQTAPAAAGTGARR